MSGGLPFGSAPGLKRGGYQDAIDSQMGRSRELPKRDGWALSTLSHVADGIAGRAALTANLLRLYYAGQFDRETTLSRVGINITTLSAGQSARTAIYVYDNTVERQLLKVPGTEAIFPADATGRQVLTLLPEVHLPLGRYFIGVKASDNVLGIGGLAAPAVNRVFPAYTYAAPAGALPPSLFFTALTRSYATVTLDVLYSSPDLAQVL